MAAVVTATSPLYALVSRQAMTDMAFVGPMTMALALGALALFDDEDVLLPRREARLGKRKITWPDHPLFYLATGLFVVVALPQLVIDSLQLEWTFTSAATATSLAGVVVMLPYIAGFVAYFVLSSAFATRRRSTSTSRRRCAASRRWPRGSRASACPCWCSSPSWRSPGTGSA